MISNYSGVTGYRGVSSHAALSANFGITSVIPFLDFPATSLIPTVGAATVTHTRSTTVTALDNSAILRTAQINEIVVPGARRVENLLKRVGVTSSAVISSATGWTSLGAAYITSALDSSDVTPKGNSANVLTFLQNNILADARTPLLPASEVQPGSVWAVRIALRADPAYPGREIFVHLSDSALANIASTPTFTIIPTSTWRTYYFITNAVVTSTTMLLRIARSTAAGAYPYAVRVGDVQWQRITSTSVQLPDDYVSVGALAAPYHGAGLDGVKYFATANGNTGASGVLTEITGAALTGVKGVLSEPAATELISTTYNRDLSAWTVISGTATVTANSTADLDGLVLADTLTGDTADAGRYLGLTLGATTIYSWAFEAQQGTTAQSSHALYDTVTLANVATLVINWAGGVPTTSSSTGCSNVRYDLATSGRYLVSFTATTGANAACQLRHRADLSGTGKTLIIGMQSFAAEHFATSIRPGLSRTANSYSFPTPSELTSGGPWSLVYTIYPSFASTTVKPGNMTMWTARTDGSNYLLVYCAAATQAMQLFYTRAGVAIFNVGGNVAFTAGSAVKICITFSPVTGYALYANGALVNSHASILPLIGATIYNNSLATIGSGSVARSQYYNTALSSARAILETT